MTTTTAAAATPPRRLLGVAAGTAAAAIAVGAVFTAAGADYWAGVLRGVLLGIAALAAIHATRRHWPATVTARRWTWATATTLAVSGLLLASRTLPTAWGGSIAVAVTITAAGTAGPFWRR